MSNGYEHLQQMRDWLGEAAASHWSDRELLKYWNSVQKRIGMKVALSGPGWLQKSEDVTPVDSVITLPVDCAKPIYLEEKSSGRPIPFSTDVMDRRVSRLQGTSLYTGITEAYFGLGTIVINSASYTTECTLWYQIRVPDLHVGTASAGGSTSLTMGANDGVDVAADGFGAKQITSYYVNTKLQVISGTGAGIAVNITAYTSGRVATLASGTYSTSSDYGTLSRLPEECWEVITMEAAMIALSKPSSVVDPQVFGFMKDRWKDANETFLEWVSTPFVGSQRTRITELE